MTWHPSRLDRICQRLWGRSWRDVWQRVGCAIALGIFLGAAAIEVRWLEERR